jgi:RNA polymerase sigma-70 factor (ECF subfamily)
VTRGDERLAQHAADDLDAAFAQIVTTWGPAVYTTALRVGLQPADAEDLAAETFVRAYQALGGYPSERIRSMRLRPWLITITLNLWRNRLRDASRRPALVALGPDEAPCAASGDPEEAVLAGAGAGRLAALLAALPEAQRVPIVLRHVVGLSYAEIGTALECPVGTVKSHVSRGLAALRAQLHADEEAGS